MDDPEKLTLLKSLVANGEAISGMMGIIVQLEDVIVELLRSDRKVATDKMAVALNATKELEPRLRNITQIIREYMEAINVRQD